MNLLETFILLLNVFKYGYNETKLIWYLISLFCNIDANALFENDDTYFNS